MVGVGEVESNSTPGTAQLIPFGDGGGQDRDIDVTGIIATNSSGDNEDIFEFTPTSLGSTTAGSYSLFLDLSAIGIDPTEDIGALEEVE